jgi:hypothetical protein
MQLTSHEFWAVIHGMVLGAIFLLAFPAGLVGLWSLKERYLTTAGVRERIPRLLVGGWVMAIVAWLTVITGTWIVYPWYRAVPPEGVTDFTDYPRSQLLSSDLTSAWHTFGMEWKEHIAWISPMLATAVAFVILYYGVQLIRRRDLYWPMLILFALAFGVAGIAGIFGAFITKAAPVV